MNAVDEQRIHYIIEHYYDILKEIKGKTFDEVTKDEILFKAVKIDLIQIGEHIVNLPIEIRTLIAEKETIRMKYIRNALVHEYETLSYDELETAVKVYIPKIIEELKKKKYLLK